MSENELEIPEDYTRMEWREDMLAYTTEPFTKSCVITGELAVTLYISCDCPDTDFMVRITDVDEQGRSIKLADGVLSAKYRNGFEKAEYLEPDGIYEITIYQDIKRLPSRPQAAPDSHLQRQKFHLPQQQYQRRL